MGSVCSVRDRETTQPRATRTAQTFNFETPKTASLSLIEKNLTPVSPQLTTSTPTVPAVGRVTVSSGIGIRVIGGGSRVGRKGSIRTTIRVRIGRGRIRQSPSGCRSRTRRGRIVIASTRSGGEVIVTRIGTWVRRIRAISDGRRVGWTSGRGGCSGRDGRGSGVVVIVDLIRGV